VSVLELFQITGSTSFAVRAALEEAAEPYVTVDVHPRRRDDTSGFAEANPLKRVPVLRDGDVVVYETGAVLLYLVERLPGRGLGPLPGVQGRAELLRWVFWLSNTLHHAYRPIQTPRFATDDQAAWEGIGRRGRETLAAHGRYLEAELSGRTWCLDGTFCVADIYLYMLKGWESYGDAVLGGEHVEAHFARVGARPAVARARELDDLDERLLRHHPELRAGKPID
jgi:glutathione S-transferase